MKILSRFFILSGIIIFAFGCLADHSFVKYSRKDAIHHIENAIKKLESGHLNQASKHVMKAAYKVGSLSLSYKLESIARKMRRKHSDHSDDQEFIEEMIHVLDEIMEDLEDEARHNR